MDRTELTIVFDSAREAGDLTGPGGQWLDRIAESLGIRLTARDTWLKIEGPREPVEAAERLFRLLRSARSRGILPREQGVLYALRAMLNGRERDLERLLATRISVASGMPPVWPRTFGQLRYVEAIAQFDCTLGIGPAGTGKTYLAMAMAVSTLLRGDVGRIILTRPAVEAGEALGFLPGDIEQKILPYLRPLRDALYDMMPAEEIERATARGVIEVAPLAFMRGRTLNHAFIILDEAQNTTPEQMFMFLTRLGFDSKCVITGDLTQTDLPAGQTSGLLEAREALDGVAGIAICELDDSDVVRHDLVQRIIQAYRRCRERRPLPPSRPSRGRRR